MKKRSITYLLALALLLCGCAGKHAAVPQAQTEVQETTGATVPADGSPEDVTCKGSYTAQEGADTVVARAGDAKLTNEELRAWYWAEVAAYRASEQEPRPDFDRPLDTQACEIDGSVNSWQQYFLREALDAWHTAQALKACSEEVPLPTEEAYKPNKDLHDTYLTDIPATKYLYGYNEYYQPNTMHQEYLDTLPQTLDAVAQAHGYGDASAMAEAAFGTTGEALESYAELYNYGYMYFTHMSYYIEPTEEELLSFYEENKASYTASGKYVDIRHVLLVPEEPAVRKRKSWEPETEPTAPMTVEVAADGTVTCDEELWAACEEKAQELLKEWNKAYKKSEGSFGDMAYRNSRDEGSALNGGAYRQVRQGQLIPVLDQWCFDEARTEGDTAILRSQYGVHLLYFGGSTDAALAQAEEDYYRTRQSALIDQAKKACPGEIDYSAIALTEAQGTVSGGHILYPDIAHERFPEIPVYLQQEYPGVMYGGFELRTNGCGITSLSMLATYMADDELTPPEMCERYGSYSHRNGTDGMIFHYEAPVLGFYLREKTYEPSVARAALEEGQVVVSIQHKGYWTGGGHYIVLEKITEDGMVQVRDSNIYNYGKLPAHKQDLHTWKSITANGSGFWIFEDKVTRIPACSRCGEAEQPYGTPLTEPYLCEKCRPALLRRDTYMTAE